MLCWDDRMKDYEELREVYEEAYSMCADYQELSALKNQTKKIIDLIPLTAPEKKERTGGIYDVLLVEVEKEQFTEVYEKYLADMLEEIAWMSDLDTEMKEWEKEYNSVKAMFK